jgi:hypothetical protein
MCRRLPVGPLPGPDPVDDRRRGADFADDDGNTWILQKIGHPQQT